MAGTSTKKQSMQLGASKKQLVQDLKISWKDASALLQEAQAKLGQAHVADNPQAVVQQAHELYQQQQSGKTKTAVVEETTKSVMEETLLVDPVKPKEDGPKLCEGQQCMIL